MAESRQTVDKGNSFPTPPLRGKRVLVTRARGQAGDLSRLLLEAGADPVELPTIQLAPPDSWEPVDRAISHLGYYDWAIFTSANGVRAFVERLQALGRDARALSGTRVAAIGPATAEALVADGIHVAFVPRDYVAESVLEGLISRGAAGKRILMPRAAEARELIVDSLRRLGAAVDEVAVYRMVPATGLRSRLIRLVKEGALDVLTFASASAVRNLVALLGEAGTKTLAGCVVVCIGPVTAAAAREMGLRVDVVASEYTIPGLVRGMEDYYRQRGG